MPRPGGIPVFERFFRSVTSIQIAATEHRERAFEMFRLVF